MIKLAIRGTTVQYAARKKKAKNNELQALERKLKTTQDKLINLPQILIESEETQIVRLQKNINQMMTEKAMGAVMQSRANWEYNADRPSKYFLNLEKYNFSKKTIYRLKRPDGTIEDDSKNILHMQKEYYENLYSTSADADLSYVRDIVSPKITDVQRQILNSPITIDELGEAVKALPNGKCPSTDELPIDFYKVFWSKIKHTLYKLYLEIIETKQFHLTARQGIISLLEKTGSDPQLLKSQRPLTLLNSDYKIFSKLLATRLHTVLTEVVHPSQTGFLKGRYISENAMKLLNLMELCERNQQSAVIISIDFTKAFDCLLWPAAFESLRVLGIDETYIDLVKILYNEPTSTVINNGFWSDWIMPTRGTRQGDPISSLIFTATAEILGIKLRTNVKIAGIDINGDTLLNVQYADDTWLALEPTEENINNAITELNSFAKYSGLVINYEKSTAFTLGPLCDTDAKFYTLKQLLWSDGKPTKILGIHFHPNWDVMHRENYEKTLDKIEEILAKWNHRSLSVPGKIVVINSLVASLLVYKFMSLPSPKREFYYKYKKIVLEFIWEKKKPKIRYNKIIQDWQYGGLKLIDIENKDHALKAAWLARWVKQNTLDDKQWLYANLPIKDQRLWGM